MRRSLRVGVSGGEASSCAFARAAAEGRGGGVLVLSAHDKSAEKTRSDTALRGRGHMAWEKKATSVPQVKSTGFPLRVCTLSETWWCHVPTEWSAGAPGWSESDHDRL